LCGNSSFEEFKEVIDTTGGVELIMKPIMSFLINYIGFIHVLDQKGFIPAAGFKPRFTKDLPLFAYFVTGVPTPGKNKQITPNMCYKISNMFSFFIAEDGVQKIPLMTATMRRQIADNIDKMTQSMIVSSNIFDDAARLCLKVTLLYCFPKYLLFKGDHQSQLKLASLQERWEKYLATETSSPTGSIVGKFVALEKRMADVVEDDQWTDRKPVPLDIWEFLSQFFFHKSITWNSTKNGMAAALLKDKGIKMITRTFEVKNLLI
jgi:hypothetical protein